MPMGAIRQRIRPMGRLMNFPSDRGAPAWEVALVALWFGVTAAEFAGDALFLYPLVLYFAGTTWLHRRHIVPFILQNPILLLMPAIYFMSILWADFPDAATRDAVYFAITFMIVYNIAARFSRRQIMIALFLALAVTALRSLPQIILYDAPLGIFTSKNHLGQRMATLSILAMAIMLDPRFGLILRSAATALIGLALFMVVSAESATAVLLTAAGMGGLFAMVVFWRPIGSVRGLRPPAIALAIATVVLTVGTASAVNGFNPYTAVLDGFGKDKTLTRRTELWELGGRLMEERPVFGVGPGSFWRADVKLAATTSVLHHRGRGDRYSFHNAYIEMAVHLGYFGLTVTIVLVLWAAIMATRGWSLRQDMPSSFFLVMTAFMIMRTFTESDFANVFEQQHMIMWMAGLFAARDLRAARREDRRAAGVGAVDGRTRIA